MLGLGFVGTVHFVIGSAIYFAGSLLSLKVLESAELKKLGATTLVLFLTNLVFFSSIELVPLVDVSFAIYWILLGNLVLLAMLNRKLDRRPFRFPYIKWVLIFLFSILLSAIFAAHIKEVIYFFVINLGAIIGFYATIYLFRDSGKSLLTMVKWLVGFGIISSVFAVWQLYSTSFKFGLYPFIAERDQVILELWELVSRVVGTWQHPSYLGIYLAISVPLAVYLMFYASKNKVEAGFWGVGIIFMSATLLLTNTRSSVLAGFFGVALLYIFANFSNWEFLHRLPNVKKIAALGLLAAAGILLYQFVFVSEIYTKPQASRVDTSATVWGRFIRSDSMSTESLVQRSQLYSLSWEKFTESPVLGIGAKNFPYEVEDLFERGTDAHNLVLQTMAEMGIIGLAAILLLYGAILREVYRQLKDTTGLRKKYLEAVLFASIILILFDGIFNNPLYSLRILAIFWLLIAFSFVNSQNIRAQNQD